jgi:hypothetical protein
LQRQHSIFALGSRVEYDYRVWAPFLFGDKSERVFADTVIFEVKRGCYILLSSPL